MDEYKLKALITCARMGSFSKAAEELSVSQSALSQLVKGVEQEWGVSLFTRSSQGIALTEEGQELYPAWLDMEKRYAALAEHVKEMAEGKRRPLRIGLYASIAAHFLAPLLSAYRRKEPDARFDIRIGTEPVRDWLAEGAIDIALGSSTHLEGFAFTPLYEDTYVAVLPTALAKGKKNVSRETLSQYPLITAPMDFLGERFGEEKNIRILCDDDGPILSMVAEGLGVAAVPELCITKIPANVTVLPLVPELHRTLGAALPAHPTRAAKRFADFVKTHGLR